MPPPKKVPQTDAIFERLSQVNRQADESPETLRLSLDAKATVNIGPFSRRGKSRTKTEAADHDFKPEATLTPFGILLPEYDELMLYMTSSPVTSDFIVDRLKDWWEFNRERFPEVTKLVLNLDNGPENHSRRTQFLKRMVGFARGYQLDIELAYYPPYHSKYNPIERCWGILELHWNGALLDSVEAVLGYAETMTWKGGHPEVVLVETEYSKGVRLSREEMGALESEVTRLPSLEKWFVSISGSFWSQLDPMMAAAPEAHGSGLFTIARKSIRKSSAHSQMSAFAASRYRRQFTVACRKRDKGRQSGRPGQ